MGIGLNFHRPKNGRTAFQAKRMMCVQRLRGKRSMLLLGKWKQLKVAGLWSFNQGMHAEKGLGKWPGASAFTAVCGA